MASKMTLIRCLVRLGGDLAHVLPPSDRGFGPGVISWPEAVLLREIHASDALESVERVGTATTTPRAEKARLTMIYGAAVPEALFPGVTPRMELLMPDDYDTAASMAEVELEAQGMAATVPEFTIDNEPTPVPSEAAPSLGDLLDGEDSTDILADEDDDDPAVTPSPEIAGRVAAPRRPTQRRAAE